MWRDRSFRVYLLAVCFVSMVCIAITAGIGLYSLVKIVAPELTIDSYTYQAHQSLDNYRKSHFYAAQLHPQGIIVPGVMGVSRPAPIRQSELLKNSQQDTQLKALPDEEVERLMRESYASLISNHRRTALQELIRLVLVILVSSSLFFLHWRLAVNSVRSRGHEDPDD